MNTDWIGFWNEITPEAPAIITTDDGKSYSYADINSMAEKLAGYLQKEFGIGKSDRICIISENCIEYIYLFACAQKTGITLCPLNYRLTPHEIAQLVEDADPALILYENQYAGLVPKGGNVKSFRMEHLTHHATSRDFAERQKEKIQLDDPIFILYTSGSTGVPKGVLYTHRMMLWNSVNTSISLGLSGKTKVLVCMPPFHTGGWNVLLTPVLHHGGTCIVTRNFDAEEVLRHLSDYGCTQFMGVPTMLKMMAAREAFASIRLDQLKYILVGGEAMPLDLIEAYKRKGILIRQGYGMTEAGPNLTSLHHSEALRKSGSIGKPNMYVELCLKDPDGHVVASGTRGELCLRGPLVTPGYWNNPEATAKTIRDGWLHTGDVAISDEEGFLYIVDRIKNMFISGGENVYPAEVERVLQNHDAVTEAVVLGVPDEKWGEVGKAFVVSRHGREDHDDILRYCNEQLSRFKIPKHFVYLDELPRNSTGKVDRRGLGEG